MNRVILIGGVGRDPEVRTFDNGGRVVSFSMATEESWRDKQSGERKKKTEWHNITVWNEGIGKVAEQYVRKGSKIAIEGQIQSRKYTDKDGHERTAFDIVIPRFGGSLELLSKPQDDGNRDGDRSGGSTSKPAAAPARHADLDDDIPF